MTCAREATNRLVELSKVITPENHADVLPRFFHTSKREAKEVSAAIVSADAPPLRTVVTVVRPPVTVADGCVADPAGTSVAATVGGSLGTGSLAPSPVLPGELIRVNPASPVVAASSARPAPARAPAPAVQVEPLTAELRRMHLTVSRRLLDKLSAARDALSHSHPGASEDEILEVRLDLILQRHAKRRGLVAKSRKPSPARAKAPVLEATAPAPKDAAPGPVASTSLPASPAAVVPPPTESKRSRYVPAHVARNVWKRDEGKCRWPVDGGGVCGATVRVQLDHIDGWALGGATTVDRMRLLCAFHQDIHARRLYGNALMDRHTKPKGGGCSEPVAPYAADRGPSRGETRAAAAERPGAPARHGRACPVSNRERPGVARCRCAPNAPTGGHGSRATRPRLPRAAPLRAEPLVRCPPAQAALSARHTGTSARVSVGRWS